MRFGLVQDNSRQILTGDILILPKIYLCPIDYQTGKMERNKKTIAIHWFAASWHTEEMRKQAKERQKKKRRQEQKFKIIHFPMQIARKILGKEKYESIRAAIKKKH